MIRKDAFGNALGSSLAEASSSAKPSFDEDRSARSRPGWLNDWRANNQDAPVSGNSGVSDGILQTYSGSELRANGMNLPTGSAFLVQPENMDGQSGSSRYGASDIVLKNSGSIEQINARQGQPFIYNAETGTMGWSVSSPEIEMRSLSDFADNNAGALPEIDFQGRAVGGVAHVASMGWNEAMNPNNSWGERLIFGGLSLAATPVAMMESMVLAPLNMVPAARDTGQYLARANLQTDSAERNIDLLHAVITGTEAFSSSLAWTSGIRPQSKITMTAEELAGARASYVDGVNSLAPDLATLRTTYATEINNVSTFKTFGIDRGAADSYLSTSQWQKFLGELRAADPTADIRKIYARAVDQLGSGSDVPELITTNSPLVKIVPQGQKVSSHSPFFTTMADLNAASKAGYSLADYFGLPVKSEASLYDIYQIAPSRPANVFMSKVAPTTELDGLVSRSGGAKQYIVPNRGPWSPPTHIGTIRN